jgi:hypothetical protein
MEISDRDSATARLGWVRELAARLDLDHPDPAYQAAKADQLARAAADLAHDLRVIAEGRRLRRHLVEDHGRTELADRQQNAELWASDHHAGVPAGTPTPRRRGGIPLMAAELLVCWVDREHDRASASDGVSRYGAYLRDHAHLFDPWQDAPDGVTGDPVEFAIAAFKVATGPIMSPGYVRWHGRVRDYAATRSDHDGSLLLSVTLAAPPPVRLGWDWRGWERDFHGNWLEPDDRRPVGLARLELRWPVPTAQLPTPRRPRRPRVANLADAAGAVAVLVDQVNATVGPVLAELEGSR